MDVTQVVILLGAGAFGGFVAGLVGVGGGIIFAPVLFYFFQGAGITGPAVAPLTVGTSLLSITVASSISAWQHHRKRAVDWSIAIRVGLLSFAVLFLVVRLITTQPWYDDRAFQLVFGTLLLLVSARMSFYRHDNRAEVDGGAGSSDPVSGPMLAGIGSAAGGIAALAGVGGGVILVPSYHQLLGRPMPLSVGTSSATIILISSLGVLTYGWSNSGLVELDFVFGYVDVASGLLLALPTLLTARLGALAAHRIDRLLLRRTFAVFAVIVALRMLLG